MRTISSSLTTSTIAALIAVLVGCGDDPAEPLAPFEPEVVNLEDNFEFQVTGASQVSTTVEYTWQNSGLRATIDHSSVVTDGSGGLVILDASGTEVYRHPLVASLNEPTASGSAGDWTIRVELTDCSGTLNFRAQKL